jgi:hypothetical protein
MTGPIGQVRLLADVVKPIGIWPFSDVYNVVIEAIPQDKQVGFEI